LKEYPEIVKSTLSLYNFFFFQDKISKTRTPCETFKKNLICSFLKYIQLRHLIGTEWRKTRKLEIEWAESNQIANEGRNPKLWMKKLSGVRERTYSMQLNYYTNFQ
jgi:hypothetical protein